MVKQIWLNLPVKDVAKSKAFFSAIGFTFNQQNETSTMACMFVGDNNFVVMLFEENQLQGYIQNKITDTRESSEMMISLDAQSKQEVDDFAQTVRDAGGLVFAEPAESQGWLYGCAFADLDGHRWNILYMDNDKKPK
ncbi:VOC family protein [Flavobacterium sp.]|uniref:VOC family protein n=1 Tax=Flavobacterium sp. TaxID=239 RepID=UPI002BF2E44B|nr:VOC family protein [Flavobacterium sp.]HSD08806.1 VOC family protein [Flavobacterium sp.]